MTRRAPQAGVNPLEQLVRGEVGSAAAAAAGGLDMSMQSQASLPPRHSCANPGDRFPTLISLMPQAGQFRGTAVLEYSFASQTAICSCAKNRTAVQLC